MNTLDINGHSFSFDLPSGESLHLKDYAGKFILVINTASGCGFTKQYAKMQELHSQFADKLLVIAVPSNDFGKQEPLNDQEIKTFCQLNYNTTFPITKKQAVKGDDAHPFFKWVASVSSKPKWNFYKYLLGPDGNLIGSFSSMTTPTSKKIITLLVD